MACVRRACVCVRASVTHADAQSIAWLALQHMEVGELDGAMCCTLMHIFIWDKFHLTVLRLSKTTDLIQLTYVQYCSGRLNLISRQPSAVEADPARFFSKSIDLIARHLCPLEICHPGMQFSGRQGHPLTPQAPFTARYQLI